MKTAKELEQMTDKAFTDYINSKCEMGELGKFVLSENFQKLSDGKRTEIEHILFAAYGNTLPEPYAWTIFRGGEFDGRVIGLMPNKTFRRAKVDMAIWGYNISLYGNVRLPNNLSGGYRNGAVVRVKVSGEFGNFEYVEKRQ